MDTPLQLSGDDWAVLGRGEPLRLSVDKQEVVVVLAEQFERLKQCADEATIDHKAIYPQIASLMPTGWEDLSAYPTAEKL
jgi:hypothetical protein